MKPVMELVEEHGERTALSRSSIQEVAAVTGAASGIGRAFATALAQRGHRLLLIDRADKRLREVADELARLNPLDSRPIASLVVDLGDVDAPLRVLRYCHRNRLRVHTLVNCAGVGARVPFAQQSLRSIHQTLDVNVRSLVALTRLLLPRMIRKGRGTIINVSSIAAFEPEAGMVAYTASKAFVQSFTEALSRELAGTGVEVFAVCPGVTRTPFLAAAGLSEKEIPPTAQTPEQVVEEAMRGIDRKRRVIVTGRQNRIRIWAQRVTLRSAARTVLRVARRLRLW